MPPKPAALSARLMTRGNSRLTGGHRRSVVAVSKVSWRTRHNETPSGDHDMFDPAVFSLPQSLAFLEKLNHFDWYKNKGDTIGVETAALRKAVAACRDKSQKRGGALIAGVLVGAMRMQQTRMAKIIRLLSLMVAQGPKVFQPTRELCEYFENVDVTLPIGDYEQSYPVVVVRLPQSYIESKQIAFPYVACLFEREHRHLTTLASNLFAFPIDSTTITHNEPTIEHALGDIRFMDESKAEWDTRLDTVRLAERIAINANLFLVDRGFRIEHMLSREQRERRESRRRRSGQRLLPPREVLLTQDVFVGVEGLPSQGDAAPRTQQAIHQKRVHYRRGHWRMQAYGEKRALRKRIFIAPILINAHLDTAAASERRVIYRTRPPRGQRPG